MWTLFVEVVVFVITIVLAMIDTSGWPGIFFYITIFSVITLNSELGEGPNESFCSSVRQLVLAYSPLQCKWLSV